MNVLEFLEYVEEGSKCMCGGTFKKAGDVLKCNKCGLVVR